jgi:hypothetical protein
MQLGTFHSEGFVLQQIVAGESWLLDPLCANMFSAETRSSGFSWHPGTCFLAVDAAETDLGA